jgi:hypothetical protein
MNNLKNKKDSKDKDRDKYLAKCDKYKEKVSDLEKEIARQESEKKEFELMYNKDYQEVVTKSEKITKQVEELGNKLKDLEESNENLTRWNEDYKIKLENVNQQNRDLSDRNITLQRLAKRSHQSNFSSQ